MRTPFRSSQRSISRARSPISGRASAVARQLLARRAAANGPDVCVRSASQESGRDEVVAHERAIGAEVVVVPDRDSHRGTSSATTRCAAARAAWRGRSLASGPLERPARPLQPDLERLALALNASRAVLLSGW